MIRVRLKPSIRLAAILAISHLAAAMLLIPLEVQFPVGAALALVVAMSLASSTWRTALLRSRSSIVLFELGDGEPPDVSIQLRNGSWHRAELLDTTCVTPVLTVLNLKMDETAQIRHVPIVGDSANEDEFRQLRVWLRWAYGRKLRA